MKPNKTGLKILWLERAVPVQFRLRVHTTDESDCAEFRCRNCGDWIRCEINKKAPK